MCAFYHQRKGIKKEVLVGGGGVKESGKRSTEGTRMGDRRKCVDVGIVRMVCGGNEHMH